MLRKRDSVHMNDFEGIQFLFDEKHNFCGGLLLTWHRYYDDEQQERFTPRRLERFLTVGEVVNAVENVEVLYPYARHGKVFTKVARHGHTYYACELYLGSISIGWKIYFSIAGIRIPVSALNRLKMEKLYDFVTA